MEAFTQHMLQLRKTPSDVEGFLTNIQGPGGLMGCFALAAYDRDFVLNTVVRSPFGQQSLITEQSVPLIMQGLQAPDAETRGAVVSLLEQLLTTPQARAFFVASGLFLQTIQLITDFDTDVAEAASQLLQTFVAESQKHKEVEGVAVFFAPSSLDALRKCIQDAVINKKKTGKSKHDDDEDEVLDPVVIRMRVYSLLCEVGAQSSECFQAVEASGITDELLALLFSPSAQRDILQLLNVVQLFHRISESKPGLSYLLTTNFLHRLLALPALNPASEDPFFDLLAGGVLKLLTQIAQSENESLHAATSTTPRLPWINNLPSLIPFISLHLPPIVQAGGSDLTAIALRCIASLGASYAGFLYLALHGAPSSPFSSQSSSSSSSSSATSASEGTLLHPSSVLHAVPLLVMHRDEETRIAALQAMAALLGVEYAPSSLVPSATNVTTFTTATATARDLDAMMQQLASAACFPVKGGLVKVLQQYIALPVFPVRYAAYGAMASLVFHKWGLQAFLYDPLVVDHFLIGPPISKLSPGDKTSAEWRYAVIEKVVLSHAFVNRQISINDAIRLRFQAYARGGPWFKEQDREAKVMDPESMTS